MTAMDSLPAAVAASWSCAIHSFDTSLRRTPSSATLPLKQCDRFLPTPFVRQRHGLLRAGNPLAAQRLVLVEQPPVLVTEDQVVRVLLQQTVHVRSSSSKAARAAARCCVVRAQQVAAHVHAQFGETAGEIPQGGEGHDPRFGHEPAARLDLRELQAGEDAKPQQAPRAAPRAG